MAYLSLAAVLNEMNRAAADAESMLDLGHLNVRAPMQQEEKKELEEEATVSEQKSSTGDLSDILKGVLGGMQ